MKGIFIFSDMNLIVEVEERRPLTGAPGYDYSTETEEIKNRGVPRRGLYPKVKIGWER